MRREYKAIIDAGFILVVAGVDCGFGTFAGRVQVDTKIVWLKLQSLSEGARRASKQLWTKAA